MIVWGNACQSTSQWLRYDVPTALEFLGCAFAPGPGGEVRACVERAFAGN